MKKTTESSRTDDEFENTVTKTMQSISSSFEAPSSPAPTGTAGRKELQPFNSRHSTGVMSATTAVNSGHDYMDNYPKSPSIHDDEQPFSH